MSLFAAAARSSHLVEFNAGKCIIEGRLIKPDTRKGMIYMEQGEDQLLHFYWKERQNESVPEDDWIIFPDEAEFTKVTQCTTGRVYLLRFKISNERHFYWMQNKSDEKDDELVERVNNLIRDPETNMSPEPEDSASHADFMRILNNVRSQDPSLTPENILHFLRNMNRSPDEMDEDEIEEDSTETNPTGNPTAVDQEYTTPIPTGTAPITDDISPVNTEMPVTTTDIANMSNEQQQSEQRMDQIRQILARLNGSPSTVSSISLNDVLNSQTLQPLLKDASVCESLMEYLPEECEKTPEELNAVIASPQFSQSLQTFVAALHTGQLGPLLSQFGLDPSILGVESFLSAINEQVKKEKKEKDAMDTD